MNLEKFYFTFGASELFPYRYGWVEIDARDESSARAIFSLYYPNRTDGCLNCAFVYRADDFEKTAMYRGEYGDKCHARITLTEE